MGTSDPRDVVRYKARSNRPFFVPEFGEPSMPIDVHAQLPSMLGIRRSEESPVHSPDAELVPDGSGAS